MKSVLKGMIVAGVLMSASWAMAQDLAKPWSVSVNAGAQYTDNRDGTKNNKQDNTDFFIEPRADVFLRDGERSRVDLFISPVAKWHSNPREASEGDPQNDTDLFGAIGVDLMHQVTPRLGLKAGDTLVYTDDPAIDAGGVNVRQSASHILNSLYGDVTTEITPQIGAEVMARSTIKRYTEQAVADNEDEDIFDTEADLAYILGSGYKVFGLAGYSSFDNASTERNRGSTVYSAGVGVEKIFNPDVHGRIQGGYQRAVYADDSFSDLDTANGRAEMVFRAQSATRFRVGAQYGFFAPYVRPYSVQTLSSVQGAIEHDLLPERLTLSLHGQYSDGKYEDEGEKLPGGHDKLGTVGLSATYRIDRNWSVGAGYTYENWDSDVRESFDRNYVDANVKAQF